MTPREIFLTSLDKAKRLGYDDKGQTLQALHNLASTRDVSGGGCVILRAAALRLNDYSTVAQWARGEWEASR